PVAPMVLAQILGSMMESNYRRAVVMFHGDVTLFFTRPIALTILALAVFTTIVAVRRQRQALRQEAAQLAALEQSSSQ
ncbi:MAG: C4-dicarboxylate transporter permease, partial [candidate division NC10 bacterium]|nr:C4-dicarboxylate transporter permease [candidate division NC10 bacterium]